jgi:SAM-dependent methyltransferase
MLRTRLRLARAVKRGPLTRARWSRQAGQLIAAAATDDVITVRKKLTTGRRIALTPAQARSLMLELAQHGRWEEVLQVLPLASVPTKTRRTLTKLAMSSGRVDAVRALMPPTSSPGTTARRLAVAYQNAGQWAEAAAAYREALKFAPGSDELWRRFERMRRKAPRWGFYAPEGRPAWSLDDHPDSAVTGLVGPAEDGHLTGWLPADAPRTDVVIKLNGAPIATARASSRVSLPDGRHYLEFTRAIAAVRSYAGAGDELTVEWQGQTLPVVGCGRAQRFSTGVSRADDLLKLIEDGYVLNKYGKVQKSVKFDRQWQSEIFDLYARLKQDIADDMNLDLFPFYGTLLGAIREQGFIGHDNDFDVVYISEYSTPDEVRSEFVRLCQALIKRGYQLHFTKTHVWVRLPGSRSNRRKIDIFFSWFTSGDQFQVSYGYHGPPVLKSPEFFKFRSEKLGDAEIAVPANSEDILTQLFGLNWRTPDPGFSHLSDSRIVDRNYWLSPSELTVLHWAQFYRDNAPAEPSPFALEMTRRLGEPGAVIELGCGSGRDSIYFASQGWRVWASDRSTEAIDRATHAGAGKMADNPHFSSVDASSPAQLQDFVKHVLDATAESNQLVFYFRFFLHAVDEQTEQTIFDTLVNTIARPFRLCAEFRTAEDRRLAKAHGQHYRRYIDTDEFVARLRGRWGFELDHFEKGQGLSPFGDEDPFLCRIIARRPSARNES